MSVNFSDKLDLLLSKKMKVTFFKKDGSKRVLICTRDMSKVPSEFHPKGTGTPKAGVMAAFDLEKNSWRSFRLDSVVSVEEM